MFDHTVGPSTAAPSDSKMVNGLAADGVLIKGGKIDIVEGMQLSADSNQIRKAVVQVMKVGGCNVETEIILAETDRLTENSIGNSKFADAGITDEKFLGLFPVSLGGTRVNALGPGLVVGQNTTPEKLGSASSIQFDLNSSDLTATSSIVRFLVDSNDASLGHFDLVLDSGFPKVESSTGFPFVADLSGPAGIAPAVHTISVSGATDSNAILNYDVVDQDSDQKFLYVTWYYKLSDYPRDAEEIMTGTDAIGSNAVDISGPGSATSNIILENLSPISDYVVRCVAEDARGNVSIPKSLDFRTTEFGAPEIVEVAGVGVGLVGLIRGIRFTASNNPDTSDIFAYAGAFLSQNALSAADLFDALVLHGTDGIFVSNIPANTASNVSVVVTKYRDNITSAAQPISENKTYYPFYLIVDSESNASLCNLDSIYYGNAPTWVTEPKQTTNFRNNKIEVSWQAQDPDSGIQTVLSHVGLGPQPLSYEDLVALVANNETESNPGTVTEKQIPTGSNLEHTTEYVVTVAAVDNSGLCNIKSFSAKTLDDVDPEFSAFSIASSGSNALVSWTAYDKSGISNVYLVEKSESWTSVTAQDIKDDNETFTSTFSTSNTILKGVPSWCNTYVFAVAEDKATDFGAANNLLSPISQGDISVPTFSNIPVNWFTQKSSSYEVEASNFYVITDSNPVASTATVYFTLFTESQVNPVLTPEAHSNFVFKNIGNVSTSNLP